MGGGKFPWVNSLALSGDVIFTEYSRGDVLRMPRFEALMVL
jgi:hypothetical protein